VVTVNFRGSEEASSGSGLLTLSFTDRASRVLPVGAPPGQWLHHNGSVHRPGRTESFSLIISNIRFIPFSYNDPIMGQTMKGMLLCLRDVFNDPSGSFF
jgi:hypothetical protein